MFNILHIAFKRKHPISQLSVPALHRGVYLKKNTIFLAALPSSSSFNFGTLSSLNTDFCWENYCSLINLGGFVSLTRYYSLIFFFFSSPRRRPFFSFKSSYNYYCQQKWLEKSMVTKLRVMYAHVALEHLGAKRTGIISTIYGNNILDHDYIIFLSFFQNNFWF